MFLPIAVKKAWSFTGAPLWRLPPRRFEEHEDSRNRTLKITETVGFIELRALRVLRGENSRQLQEKTMVKKKCAAGNQNIKYALASRRSHLSCFMRYRNPLSAGCQLAAWSANGVCLQKSTSDQAARLNPPPALLPAPSSPVSDQSAPRSPPDRSGQPSRPRYPCTPSALRPGLQRSAPRHARPGTSYHHAR